MRLRIGKDEINIKNIRTDSREVKPGDVFIAYKGVKLDGHDFIGAAIARGARVIVGERDCFEVSILKENKNVRYFKVKDGREVWAELEAQFHKMPQNRLKIIGVTGTDGKTTTCHLIYEILRHVGKKVGIISTVLAKYGDRDIKTGLHVTSPTPNVLFRILREMVDAGVKYVVLEVTSHGLKQRRVHGINFVVSCVTNVTPEHLDEHKTYDQLIKDKATIFERSDVVFLNGKGKGYRKLRQLVSQNIKSSGKLFEVDPSVLNKRLMKKIFAKEFPGEYNLQNAALAYSVCRFFGVGNDAIYKSFERAVPPKGRFQRIPNKRGLNIIVDFAHTENSMREILKAVGKLRAEKERIITVFGCAGERDKQKRSAMGKTSSELSDIVVVTSEDPRAENPDEIIKQVVLGNNDFQFEIEPDRKKAIQLALSLAKEGDWLLFLGKGHERSMNIGGIEYPWNEVKVVEGCLGGE